MNITLRQKAYHNIKHKIIYFELKPNEKIMESKLSRMLNIGRVPVREALTMLESEGFIYKSDGYGYKISRLNDSELEDHFKIRSQLEMIGAEMLVERATGSDIKKLKKHVEKAKQIYQGNDIQKIIESDTRFHDLMYLATKSDLFYRTVSILSEKAIIMRAAAMTTLKGRNASLKDHIEILEAIENRDLKKLKTVLYEHLKFAPNYYESIGPLFF